VESTAYVGPDAQVLGQAQVRGVARIEGFAIVQDNAVVEDSAVVSGHAIVGEDAHIYGRALVDEHAHVFGGCSVYDSAVIKGNTQIFLTSVHGKALLKDNTFCWGANLHGDITLGGDAEFFSECSDGTYYQVSWAYDRNCDGRDYHPSNTDITFSYPPPHIHYQFKLLCDTLVPNTYTDTFAWICERDTFLFYDQLITNYGVYDQVYEASNGGDSIIHLSVDETPLVLLDFFSPICPGDTLYAFGQPITESGPFEFYLDTFECGALVIVSLQDVHLDTTVISFGNTLYAPNFEDALQWYDCNTGLPVPGATDTEFSPTVSGSYRLEVTSIFGNCMATSSCYEVLISSTIVQQPSFQWHIQPNPAHNLLQVLLDDAQSDLLIEVYDMTGLRQFRETMLNTGISETIDLEKLSSGTYVIKLTNASGQSSSKTFIKM
jgi:carbonic anhydrase/acetyltransferase-like protein (isoleucine patch superfamily)